MMEEKKNPVLTVYDEECGKYFDITIDLDLLENAELSEEERATLEAMLEEAKAQEAEK